MTDHQIFVSKFVFLPQRDSIPAINDFVATTQVHRRRLTRGKPKIFLIQARRVEPFAIQTGMQDEPSDTSEVMSCGQSLSSCADIMEVWYTPRGSLPLFNEQIPDGSNFICAFVSVVKNSYREKHIKNILREVIIEFNTNPKYANVFEKLAGSDIPIINSTLTKKCFL